VIAVGTLPVALHHTKSEIRVHGDAPSCVFKLRRPLQWKNNAQTSRLIDPVLPRIANTTKLLAPPMSLDLAVDNATNPNNASCRWIRSGTAQSPGLRHKLHIPPRSS